MANPSVKKEANGGGEKPKTTTATATAPTTQQTAQPSAPTMASAPAITKAPHASPASMVVELDEDGIPKAAPAGGTAISFDRYYWNHDECKGFPIYGAWFDRIVEKEEASPFIDQKTGRKGDFIVYLVRLKHATKSWDKTSQKLVVAPAGAVLRVPENAGVAEMANAITSPRAVPLVYCKFARMKDIGGGNKMYTYEWTHYGMIPRDEAEPGGTERVLELQRMAREADALPAYVEETH